MKAAVFVCLALGTLAAIRDWAPQQPQWPDTFTASWNEQADFTGEMRYTGGEGLYDLPNGHLVWARTNGVADPVCNTSVPLQYDTPCSHVIADGNHYLYTPNLNQCCLCCTAAQGCGLPTSSGFANFTYQEAFQYYGKDVYLWTNDYNGYEVAYLETTETNPTDRSWVGLFSQYDNYTYVWQFNAHVDTSGFRLPSQCSGASDCPSGACAYMRNREGGRLRSSRSLIHQFPLF